MNIKDIYKKVAKETGIPVNVVEKTYKAYWRAVREHISSLPLKENLSKEEFLALKSNVNIPSLGKFYVTLDRYMRLSKFFKSRKEDENAAH